MIPTREIFWNIGDVRGLVHLLMLIPIFLLLFGLLFHFRQWRRGRRDGKLQQLPRRFFLLLWTVLTHRTILADRFAGVMHLFIFWGVSILALGTFVIFFQDNIFRTLFESNLFRGNFYLFFELILDVAGVFALVGISMALYRRYISKPKTLDVTRGNAFVLLFLVLIILSGFILEGLRLSVTNAPESSWSPVGSLFIFFFEYLDKDLRLIFHRFLWWIHLGMAFFLIASLPFLRLFHLFSSSLNIFFNGITSGAPVESMDLEAERLGVNRINDFERRSLVALDACTECGRCQSACPAYLSEKPLNPKKVIVQLRRRMEAESNFLFRKTKPRDLIGRTVKEEEIWACTTCLNCVKKCPVFVEPMRNIQDFRRFLILMESQMPTEIERLYRNLEWFGDSMGMGKTNRDELIRAAKIQEIGIEGSNDFLFWVGCQGYFHERNQITVTALFKLFKRLNLSFTVLGREEICCGDIARKTGNEYLFKSIAEKNLKLLDQKRIGKIVTHCPHCYNVLKNEYPQLGAKIEVFHSTEILREALKKTPLRFVNDVFKAVTIHDPCYLSRYNGIIGDLRDLVALIPGMEVVEMARSGEDTFCCGAGGGSMWLGAQSGKRMNQIRGEEALGTKADGVLTACPYCLNMIEDGIKDLAKETTFQVVDIVEMLERTTG